MYLTIRRLSHQATFEAIKCGLTPRQEQADMPTLKEQ